MAWLDRDGKKLLTGVGLGAVGVMAAPYVFPILAAALRPLLRAVITHGMVAFEIAREQAALLREQLEDTFSEATVDARARIEERRARIAGTPPTAPPADATSNGQPAAGLHGKPVHQA